MVVRIGSRYARTSQGLVPLLDQCDDLLRMALLFVVQLLLQRFVLLLRLMQSNLALVDIANKDLEGVRHMVVGSDRVGQFLDAKAHVVGQANKSGPFFRREADLGRRSLNLIVEL